MVTTNGWQRPHNFRKFEGPVLNCRCSTHTGGVYLNELVIHEIRNTASARFQNFVSSWSKIEFVQCGKNPWSLRRPWVGHCHPRTAEASRIFTTTGRILFYNSWKETFGKLQMHCSEFQQWLIHLNTHPWGEYCPYSLVPDPQISKNCEASAIPGRVV